MTEGDVERMTRRANFRMKWQLSLLYSKPLAYIRDRVKDICKVINRISLEITMLQHFIDVNQLDATIDCSLSSTDWTSDPSASIHVSTNTVAMGFMKMPGKRSKKRDLNIEHKLSIAHHYLRSITERYEVQKRNAHAYFNELLAADENLALRWKTIQNEISCMIFKLGSTVCFPSKKKYRDLRSREQLSSAKWRATIVCANHMNRDHLIRITKLENVSLLEQIKNVEVICKYEEKVDVAEFFRKMLEKCSFPTETKQLAHKRGKLQSHMEVVERKSQKLRRLLEKEVINGEELRERIARERKTIGKVEQSLAMSEAATDKERARQKKLTALLDDYRGPQVHEYILLCRRDTELREMVKTWQHKVAAAKIVMDMNQQKWKKLKKH